MAQRKRLSPSPSESCFNARITNVFLGISTPVPVQNLRKWKSPGNTRELTSIVDAII